MERSIDMAKSYEREEAKVTYIARLEDLGLGNESGIPSSLENADQQEIEAYAENLCRSLEEITDFEHFGCIDGRECLENADGSRPEVRRRQVGASGAFLEIALNSNSPVLEGVSFDVDLGDAVSCIESYMQNATGIKPAAHLGGCGGVNGAIKDNENISNNQSILDGVEAVVSLPEVRNFSGIDYELELGKALQERAGKTAQLFNQKGWDGSKYVDGVKNRNPKGVEDLHTKDDVYQGHDEPAIVLVLNTGEKEYSFCDQKMGELNIKRPFVIHINASLEVAKAMATSKKDIAAAFLANIAKHIAVADRLPSHKTPLFLLVTY